MTPAIFGIGPSLSQEERAFFADADPAGYILFARNCEDKARLRRLTDDLRSIHGREQLIISIDQEGGRGAMKPPVWQRYPAGEAFARLWDIAPASAIEAARANAEAMGRELAEMGITVDYHAPFDVRRKETDAVIGDRALGSDPLQVAALGRAVLDGMSRAGIVGCLKHMPGHGRATCDSHKELPRVAASDEDLAVDLEPFRTLAAHPLGMSAHIAEAWIPTIRPRSGQGDRRDPSPAHRLRRVAPVRRYRHAGADGTIPVRRALQAVRHRLELLGEDEDQRAIAEQSSDLGSAAAERLERVHDAMTAPQDGPDTAELLAKRDALLGLAEDRAA